MCFSTRKLSVCKGEKAQKCCWLIKRAKNEFIVNP